MAETFSQEQGKRLFSFISAGASSGAILGPAIPTLFAESLGLPGLMLMAAIGLMVAIPVIIYLTNNRHSESNHLSPKDAVKQTMEGHWWSGFRDVMKNPVLIGIALFILLYVFINSFVYFQQKNLLAAFSRADRAQILGGIDWLVNLLTFVFALAITSRMVKRMGMSLTLACVPFAMVFGFVVLALAPVVVVLLGIQTFRRVGNYAITRPAREMLFTQVSLEERFKAKPVIDVVVYRGGDAISASVYAVFSDSLGLGLFALSLIGASIAGAWASIGLMLGRLFDQKTKQSINKTTVDIESTENKSTKQFIT